MSSRYLYTTFTPGRDTGWGTLTEIARVVMDLTGTQLVTEQLPVGQCSLAVEYVDTSSDRLPRLLIWDHNRYARPGYVDEHGVFLDVGTWCTLTPETARAYAEPTPDMAPAVDVDDAMSDPSYVLLRVRNAITSRMGPGIRADHVEDDVRTLVGIEIARAVAKAKRKYKKKLRKAQAVHADALQRVKRKLKSARAELEDILVHGPRETELYQDGHQGGL